MTIAEAIAEAGRQREGNRATEDELIRWLNEADWRIKREVFDTHLCSPRFGGYTKDTPRDTDLLAPEPYDKMYIYWLCASIDLLQGDTARYNQSITLYNSILNEYAGYYCRNYHPRLPGTRYY